MAFCYAFRLPRGVKGDILSAVVLVGWPLDLVGFPAPPIMESHEPGPILLFFNLLGLLRRHIRCIIRQTFTAYPQSIP